MKLRFMALRAYIEKSLPVDFEHGNCLWRIFNKEDGLWQNLEAPLPPAKKKYPRVTLTDELLKRKLKN